MSQTQEDKDIFSVIDFNLDSSDDAVIPEPLPDQIDEPKMTFRSDRKKKTKKKEEKPDSAMKEFLSWILTCAIAVGIAFFLKQYIIITANVPTGSMENTITPGDNLVGYRLAYLNSDPKRGDIVIFYNPDNTEEKYIKRIIGLPGETLTIEDSVVYINGEPLEEDYLKEKWIYYNDGYEFEIPENCYFMMGDNRNNSKDARLWNNTYVSRDMIIGKALWVYWPIKDWGSLMDTPVYGLD